MFDVYKWLVLLRNEALGGIIDFKLVRAKVMVVIIMVNIFKATYDLPINTENSNSYKVAHIVLTVF